MLTNLETVVLNHREGLRMLAPRCFRLAMLKAVNISEK